MRQIYLIVAVGLALTTESGIAQQAAVGPYKILKTAKVGGVGNFDFVYADAEGRRLYIPRTVASPRISVFNLDTLDPVGEIPNVSARGVAVGSPMPRRWRSSTSCLRSIDRLGSFVGWTCTWPFSPIVKYPCPHFAIS